jgi:LPXTG-motif cell wall-anchored protein
VPVHIVHSVGQLPFTGSDVLGLLLMGVAAVTIGLAIVRNRRLFD